MKKERRWLKSVIVASQSEQVVMPWYRSAHRKPVIVAKAAPAPIKYQAQAAR